MADETARAIEATFRIERARLIATLARLTGSLDQAEERAHDALAIALAEWPRTGIPANPAAWLTTTAKRRAIDSLRHEKMRTRKHAELARDPTNSQAPDPSPTPDLGDDLLALIFTACHPALSPDARAALTLRVVGGLTTAEIARAFLVPEPTIAQRITRAKKTLAAAGARFVVPQGTHRAARLPSVLEILYLIFNEGYAATRGEALTRPALCHQAMRLGRTLVALMPNEPEALGLLALMELQASRLPARQAADGSPIPIASQNRARWDQLLIRRGLAALARAQSLAPPGPYTLQAALAACHATARTATATDWPKIANLYDQLFEILPSPIVALNRAIAHSISQGPQAGLALLDALATTPTLKAYAPYHAARADCLLRAGRPTEARPHFQTAATLTQNPHEATYLLTRAQSCEE